MASAVLAFVDMLEADILVVLVLGDGGVAEVRFRGGRPLRPRERACRVDDQEDVLVLTVNVTQHHDLVLLLLLLGREQGQDLLGTVDDILERDVALMAEQLGRRQRRDRLLVRLPLCFRVHRGRRVENQLAMQRSFPSRSDVISEKKFSIHFTSFF